MRSDVPIPEMSAGTSDPAELAIGESVAAWVPDRATLQIDVTGQVNAESVGEVQIGNAGGLASIHRAAAASPAGRAIVAIRSLTSAGAATVVAGFGASDPVTSLRADADVYVTEFGSVSLRGKPIATRVAALAALAHPDQRAPLLARAAMLGLLTDPG